MALAVKRVCGSTEEVPRIPTPASANATPSTTITDPDTANNKQPRRAVLSYSRLPSGAVRVVAGWPRCRGAGRMRARRDRPGTAYTVLR